MKRKRLSIKTRVTLWYTTLLAVLVGLVAAAVLVMSDSMEEMQAKKILENAVNHAADLLVYDGTDVTFLEPVDTYEGGIYLLFYDEKYQFLVPGPESSQTASTPPTAPSRPSGRGTPPITSTTTCWSLSQAACGFAASTRPSAPSSS